MCHHTDELEATHLQMRHQELLFASAVGHLASAQLGRSSSDASVLPDADHVRVRYVDVCFVDDPAVRQGLHGSEVASDEALSVRSQFAHKKHISFEVEEQHIQRPREQLCVVLSVFSRVPHLSRLANVHEEDVQMIWGRGQSRG